MGVILKFCIFSFAHADNKIETVFGQPIVRVVRQRLNVARSAPGSSSGH